MVEMEEVVEVMDEEKELQEAVELLRKHGFLVDWGKKILRKGREKVYFVSESNMKRMIYMIYDVLSGCTTG